MSIHKSHNLWLGINDKPSNETDDARIYIYYKYGVSSGIKKRCINVSIPFNVWDKSIKDISRKAKSRSDLKAQVEEINRMQLVIRDCIIKMNRGLMTYTSAFDLIEGKNEDGTVPTWLEHTKKVTERNKSIYSSRLDGI